MHGEPLKRRFHFMSEQNTNSTVSGTPIGEISQSKPAMEEFLDKHQMKIIVLAAVLCVVAVIMVIYRGIEQSAEEEAGRQLVSAEATSELQEVVNGNEGTAAAESAKVLLAEQQWNDGLKDEAIATLSSLVEAGKSHPAVPNAKASLAVKLWAQGKQDEAKEMFRDLTENPAARHLAPFAWMSLGDMAMSAGDTEAAKDAYQTVQQDFPTSNFSSDAKSRILLLEAESPKKITPPVEIPEIKLDTKESGDGDIGSTQMTDLLQGGGNPADQLISPVQEETAPAVEEEAAPAIEEVEGVESGADPE